MSEVVATDYLRNKLLEYVGDGDASVVKNMQDAEIGQRIYAAMQMVTLLKIRNDPCTKEESFRL